MVALHPQTTPDPATLDWVTPATTLPVTGCLTRLPADLQALADHGVIADVVAHPGRISITLADGHDWQRAGAQVRTALLAGLAEPHQWVSQGGADPLTAALQEVIRGEVGDFIRSHGGDARIVDVTGDSGVVALSGTCQHCPARGATFHQRFEKEVRRRYPHLARLELRDS